MRWLRDRIYLSSRNGTGVHPVGRISANIRAILFQFALLCCIADSNIVIAETIFEGRDIILLENADCGDPELPCAMTNIISRDIYVNLPFINLNPLFQKAILYHEIGHLEHNHIWLGRRTKYEIEADMYSAEEGYTIPLYIFLSYIDFICLGQSEEITLRLEALESYYRATHNGHWPKLDLNWEGDEK